MAKLIIFLTISIVIMPFLIDVATTDHVYFAALFCIFIVHFSDTKYMPGALIILIFAVVNICLVDVISPFNDFVSERKAMLHIDGFMAVTLSFLYRLDKRCITLSILAIFACITHSIVIYEVNNPNITLLTYVYTYYEEIIYTIMLLQLWVLINGFTSAFINVRDTLQNIGFRSVRGDQDCNTHSKGAEKT